MSLRETPLTRWYWREILKRGTLIEEYVAVERGENDSNAPRFMDGLVILDGPFEISGDVRRDVQGKDVVVIQSKNKRLGMYLMGQALFSREPLLKKGRQERPLGGGVPKGRQSHASITACPSGHRSRDLSG